MNTPPAWRRGFWCLMATQCQNAFSDNALKNLVILLVLSRDMSQSERDNAVALAGALFALPFITFSMFGGWLADRFSKQRVMSGVKQAEIVIMLFAALALALHSLPLQLGAVFLMGCHSACFGPSKYGILPEVLPLEKLSWGNGILELLTFVGIILGTLSGGILAGQFSETPWISGLLLAALARLARPVGLRNILIAEPARSSLRAAPGRPLRAPPKLARQLRHERELLDVRLLDRLDEVVHECRGHERRKGEDAIVVHGGLARRVEPLCVKVHPHRTILRPNGIGPHTFGLRLAPVADSKAAVAKHLHKLVEQKALPGAVLSDGCDDCDG
jgi:MFS family permease